MAREGAIIICGAGFSALGLANGLLKHGIAFHVYEADPNLDSRGQGYRIRVHGGGGEALEDLLSPEMWRMFLESCGKLNGMASLSAQEARELPSPFPPGARGPGNSATPPITSGLADRKQLGPYVVDRSVLRRILFREVKSHVTFGKRVDRVEGITAHFTDGTSVAGARLIVGSDGANSRLRAMAAPSIKLYDTRSRCVSGKTLLSRCEHVHTTILNSMTLTRDSAPDLALFSEPVRFKSRNSDALSEFEVPSDYLHWVLVGDEKRFPKGRTREAQALKKATLEMTVGWHPFVRAVLEEQSIDESQLLPIRSTRPQNVAVLRDRDDVNVVILLEDALHANTALIDAQILVQLLIDEDNVDDVYLKYQRKMTEYAPKAVEKSVAGGKNIFGMSSLNEWTIWTPQEKVFDRHSCHESSNYSQSELRMCVYLSAFLPLPKHKRNNICALRPKQMLQ